MTMMMSLSLAMIQMLTIASEDQPNQCHTHRIFFCGNKHQMRSDLFPPLHKQTKRFWWWYFSKLKKKDVRKNEARRYCVWHFAQSHPIFIQNWASTKSQVVYLAISPPPSFSLDWFAMYLWNWKRIDNGKTFRKSSQQKRKFNVVPSNFLMSSLKKRFLERRWI